ncbi:MAG: DUF1343 domain-containing protein [Bacteroidetes bacterium]|nr:DUF1343 domain-containing protein [Bacteroidota bacterium]
MLYNSRLVYLLCLLMLSSLFSFAREKKKSNPQIIPGAWQLDEYLPILANKRVALLINQTSQVSSQSLLDTLLKRGVQIQKIFVPEHGFRGVADAGAHVKNDLDQKTGVPIFSLYGNNKKPTQQQLNDIDVLIYDLQDVGVRFYTYISTLQYAMEACSDAGKLLLLLDRPNPNGHYVDGFVLEPKYQSFVGMQPVPVVYGMTAGEYARMLVGEQWFIGAKKMMLKIIPCKNYDHQTYYTLPIAPSPNLQTMSSVYLYPSLCFFEGTVVSVGRGTDKPFQQWGHPEFEGKSNYYFLPKATVGASNPLYGGKKCFGEVVAQDNIEAFQWAKNGLNFEPLIKAYQWYPQSSNFFNNFISKLAGTDRLENMIREGKNTNQIRASWKDEVDAFKKIRTKYLLYRDFE